VNKGTRQEFVRSRNRRIAASAARLRFEPGARVPFLCECDDHSCQEIVLLTLDAFSDQRVPLIVAGHSA